MNLPEDNPSGGTGHVPPKPSPWSDEAIERAASLFRAAGDPARLRTLELLSRGEACVTGLAEAGGERMSTVSQRLRLLRAQGLVERRREGRHIFYRLTDDHVSTLLSVALTHASEQS